MSARDRLAAALQVAVDGDRHTDLVYSGVVSVEAHREAFASHVLAADPHLAQDIEDGAALRRLREVLGPHETFDVSVMRRAPWVVEAWHLPTLRHMAKTSDKSLAAAADKARGAIEATR